MIDSHSHSTISHDGKIKLHNLREQAENIGMQYFAVTEHLDRDYRSGTKERFVRQLNVRSYRRKFLKELKNYPMGDMYFAFGMEVGFAPGVARINHRLVSKYDFDIIINSIHTIDGGDAYLPSFWKKKEQDLVYNRYLDLLYKSLMVPYQYDVVGHIGYITRYAPYENKSLWQPQYQAKIDKILLEIIRQGKTIEINTHSKGGKSSFLPEYSILRRYKELGGENITFSSDAHRQFEVGKGYLEAVDIAKSLGFKYWTIYKAHKPYAALF